MEIIQWLLFTYFVEHNLGDVSERQRKPEQEIVQCPYEMYTLRRSLWSTTISEKPYVKSQTKTAIGANIT